MLHSIAYHDNSLRNKENPDPTAFIGWGDRTVDEMNIGWLDFHYISDDEIRGAAERAGEAFSRAALKRKDITHLRGFISSWPRV